MGSDGGGSPERAGDFADFSGRTAQRVSDAQRLHASCHGLAEQHPDFSIRQGVTDSQRCGGWSLIGALVVFAIARPEPLTQTGMLVISGLFVVVILFRLSAAIAALIPAGSRQTTAPDPERLPVVTVLAPLYREANMVQRLINAICQLDYPRHLLDVKFLVEADDAETLAALQRVDLTAMFDVVALSPALPRTKPKALNYGLQEARGEIVCIFDAEDRPAASQIRMAVAAFEKLPRNVAVLQAPLLTHNGAASWIAGQFQIEYAIHFLVWLPFIQRLNWPIALGGTSNYFRREALEEAGGWDPWNVTEDADLGLRLARLGYGAGIITAPTMEEAPVRLPHWMNQRTRWMKGHLQTWLVMMRDPPVVMRQLGLSGFVGFQLMIGGALVASFCHLPIMAYVLAGVILPSVELHSWHGALFGLGYGSVLAAAIATREVRFDAWRLITLPFYWPLLSIAMYRALWEMRTRPHYWAKTPHGVTV